MPAILSASCRMSRPVKATLQTGGGTIIAIKFKGFRLPCVRKVRKTEEHSVVVTF